MASVSAPSMAARCCGGAPRGMRPAMRRNLAHGGGRTYLRSLQAYELCLRCLAVVESVTQAVKVAVLGKCERCVVIYL